jgi:hypothetical protein
MKPRILFTLLLSSLCPLCLGGESFALDPETKTPYQLKVYLQFAEHRLLTDVFQDRVARELRDGLQASFGDLVNVTVEGMRGRQALEAAAGEKANDDARLAEVRKYGLKALDAWRERSAVKTHFVQIDYSGVQYTIQARQFDGLTGTPSTVIRSDRTRYRDFVAKAAALLVEQDFGLVGVFDRWPKKGDAGEDKAVTLELQGAGLGVPLDRWIKKGDVFSVVQMPPGDAGPGKPVLYALLQVDTPPAAADSSCVCRVFRRYDPPRDAGGGYRCIRLGTIATTLHLRLLQALPDGGSGPLKDALSVQIRHHGFDDAAGEIRRPTDNKTDSVDTTADKNGVFDRVAFVSVFSANDMPQARVPVALLDDQPVVLAINVVDDPNAQQALRRHDWERDVTAAWLEQKELFSEVNDLAAKPDKRAEAMKKIQEGVQRSSDDFDRLNKERQELAKSGPVSTDAAARLGKINDGANELNAFLGKLQEIDKADNDPKKKQLLAQVEQAKRLEADLEIGKAIALYEGMLKEEIKDDELKKNLESHLADLRKEWATKNDEHRKARAFLFEVWPTLDDEGLKAKLDEAKAALETCKKAGDATTLTKFLRAADGQVARMNQELGTLRPDINIADEMQAKVIKEALDAVAPLVGDVSAYLKINPAGK